MTISLDHFEAFDQLDAVIDLLRHELELSDMEVRKVRPPSCPSLSFYLSAHTLTPLLPLSVLLSI